MCQFCSISQGSTDILVCQLWVGLVDLRRRHAISQAAHDHCHGDPSPFDTRLAVVKIRRDHNPLLPSHTSHLDYLPSTCSTGGIIPQALTKSKPSGCRAQLFLDYILLNTLAMDGVFVVGFLVGFGIR